ncbi:hypothetical protein [Planotetraspora sp. GP83]|uniref:hypothetical protein n=1 Tax=Planotetraspora sp. GP83 TaxID=3156264 RepID=UPI003518FC2B
MTRRALLGTAAAGLAVSGCSFRTGQGSGKTGAHKPPDPQTVLLISLIAAKEQMIALYQRAALSDAKRAGTLEQFRQRHVAHLAALRKLLPRDAAPTPSPSPSPSEASGSPSQASGSPSQASGSAVSAGRLRDAERRAAAGRPAQTAGVSPALAQLLAGIGACEAVHVIALGRLRD